MTKFQISRAVRRPLKACVYLKKKIYVGPYDTMQVHFLMIKEVCQD